MHFCRSRDYNSTSCLVRYDDARLAGARSATGVSDGWTDGS